MKVVEFDLNLKSKPEDFIVKEIASYESGNNHYLYLLVKRDYNLFDLTKKYSFSFAGIKDKKALTFQYVSFDEFKGSFFAISNFKERVKNKEPWYFFRFVKKIKRKVRPGFLKGNEFFIKVDVDKIEIKDWFVNYYDLQRLKDNWRDGLEILLNLNKSEAKRIKKDRIKSIKVDAFLSYLWNKSLELFLKENSDGYYIKDENFYFFIPYNKLNLNYWPILGYKLKEDNYLSYYESILERFNLNLDLLFEKLRLLRFKGDFRKVFVDVDKKRIINNYFNFILPKGCYATMYLKFVYKV